MTYMGHDIDKTIGEKREDIFDTYYETTAIMGGTICTSYAIINPGVG